MSDVEALFRPLQLGRYRLRHRVVMPPLTRMRADAATVPNALAPLYYGQRATEGGLLIAEATQAVPAGQGYIGTPGIHSAAQVAAWKEVVDAVHAKGGIIFLQLWHTGRASHSSFQPGGALPVGPSAIAISDPLTWTATGERVPYEVPRALESDEIAGVVEGFRQGAAQAMEAGFDGVELHGANGFLIEQFLKSGSNRRTDAYGGSVAARSRLLLETTTALIDVWGADRVGVRLSPFGTFNDVHEPDVLGLYSHVFSGLSELGIAYLHLIQARTDQGMAVEAPTIGAELRQLWPGTLLLAGGFDAETAARAIRDGAADAVAFGRHFIANPDLPARLRVGAELNPYDRSTFYFGSAEGYTDYPALTA